MVGTVGVDTDDEREKWSFSSEKGVKRERENKDRKRFTLRDYILAAALTPGRSRDTLVRVIRRWTAETHLGRLILSTFA